MRLMKPYSEQLQEAVGASSVTKKGDVWTIRVDGKVIRLNKAQNRALREYERMGTSPKRAEQLAKKGLTSPVYKGDKSHDRYWGGTKQVYSVGVLTPLGEKVVALILVELGVSK